MSVSTKDSANLKLKSCMSCLRQLLGRTSEPLLPIILFCARPRLFLKKCPLTYRDGLSDGIGR